jgi:DMSO/TMAO reductase YedYZ molybdopterin-dependent catalytic subunit
VPTLAAPSPTAAGATAEAAATAAPTTQPTASPTVIPAFVPAPSTRSPFNTNETLYVISSNTRDPEVARDEWRLEIAGAVASPFSLSYSDLLALPRVDQTSTLECISNEVGNYLIGNVKWSGVRLRDLLERAGLQEGVTDIKLSAAEGYTESIPLAKALDPTSLVVYGIDGEALSVKHGFPARLIVPGLYGEKNVKWLTKIEPVHDDYRGYWQQRGWTDSAVIATTSVIDTNNPFLGQHPPLPREGGIVPLGGIAFAGNRGVNKVEVQIDGGDWREAQLDPQSDPLTWRFWRYDWMAEPGSHTVSVRATDGDGMLQTEVKRDPHPDGATGIQQFSVEVA